MFSKFFDFFLRSTPGRLVLCLLFTAFFGPMLSVDVVRGAYTISNIFVEILNVCLPIIIFVFLTTALVSIENKAPLFLILLVGSIFISNSCAQLFAFGSAAFFLPKIALEQTLSMPSIQLEPFFNLPIPRLIGLEATTMGALLFSFAVIFLPFSTDTKMRVVQPLQRFQAALTHFLMQFFVPVIPIYVLGFLLKMSHEGFFTLMCQHYLPVAALNVGVVLAYMCVLYLGAALLLKKPLRTLAGNMVPASLTAFSTLSSTVTMPLTLIAAEKNLKSRTLSQLIIPSTVNTHVLGDNLTVTVTALALLILFGQPLPSLISFASFMFFFSVANFSAVSLPGGSVLVIMPVIQKYLGFSPEMISILTTLYILQDPFSTCGNVIGNGGFALYFGKLLRVLKIVPAEDETIDA